MSPRIFTRLTVCILLRGVVPHCATQMGNLPSAPPVRPPGLWLLLVIPALGAVPCMLVAFETFSLLTCLFLVFFLSYHRSRFRPSRAPMAVEGVVFVGGAKNTAAHAAFGVVRTVTREQRFSSFAGSSPSPFIYLILNCLST